MEDHFAQATFNLQSSSLWWQIANVILQVVVLAVTLAVLWFSYRALKASKEAVEISQRSFDHAEWVFKQTAFPQLSVQLYQFPNDVPAYESILYLEITNIGLHPTKIRNIRIASKQRSEGEKNNEDLQMENLFNIPLNGRIIKDSRSSNLANALNFPSPNSLNISETRSFYLRILKDWERGFDAQLDIDYKDLKQYLPTEIRLECHDHRNTVHKSEWITLLPEGSE